MNVSRGDSQPQVLPGKLAVTKRVMRKRHMKNKSYLLLLLPPLIIFVIGMIIPLVMGIYNSFTDWDGISLTKKWVGLANYVEIFKDQLFINAFKFTLLFMIFNTIIQNVAALLFAVLLDSNIRAKNFYRVVIFSPVLLSPILVGQIWTKMYSTVLPSLNSLFGTKVFSDLFASPHTVLGGLLIANNWQWIGYWMLIYLAGLQSIPKELYEASTVDGGNAFQKFFHITIPMLGPSITICTVGIATGSLKVYELIVASTSGGPGQSSQSLVMYIFNSAFTAQRAAYASAMSVVFLIVLLVFAFIQLKFLRKREVEL